MNPRNAVFMPLPYNNDVDFFELFRSYLKFSIAVVFFFVMLVILVWNWQPWFEIEIKPAHKLQNEKAQSTNGQNFGPKLQSDVELVNYVVRPGDTLSAIAERFDVGLSALLKHNGIDNPNTLRSGQRLKIPRRRNQ